MRQKKLYHRRLEDITKIMSGIVPLVVWPGIAGGGCVVDVMKQAHEFKDKKGFWLCKGGCYKKKGSYSQGQAEVQFNKTGRRADWQPTGRNA